jgi:hypothetical protein
MEQLGRLRAAWQRYVDERAVDAIAPAAVEPEPEPEHREETATTSKIAYQEREYQSRDSI